MKFAIWCLVIVGVYFIYQNTVGKIFREYESCYTIATTKVEEIEQTQSQTSQCTMQKLAYDEMVGCFTNLKKESNIIGMLYDAAPVSKKVATDFVTHNEACPAYQLEEPKMSLYLNSGSNL